MRTGAGVLTGDCGCLGVAAAVTARGPGLISGEARTPDRLRPCRSAPAGASWPPPAPAGAIVVPGARNAAWHVRVETVRSSSAAAQVAQAHRTIQQGVNGFDFGG